MRPGFVARLLMRGIGNYRASSLHDRVGHGCRFTPTCSHYADDALLSRALPMALVLIAWRLLRCTSRTPMGTVDVVRRPRRGVARRAAAVLGLSALTTLIVAGTAAAVSTKPQATTAGGCTAFVGGVPIGQLDSDHPLQVHKGQRIVLTGLGPVPDVGDLRSVTTAKIHFIEKIATRTVTEPGTGARFQKSVNVDTYLRYGSGVYRVDAVSVSPGAWSCSATFYVELHGSKLAAEVAVAVGAVGAAGMAASARGEEPDEDALPPKEDADGLVDPTTPVEQFDKFKKDKARSAAASGGTACLAGILFALIASTGAFAFAAPVGPTPRGGGTQVVWTRGHPVLGFISGLICGLGTTVALQQFGFYPLTVVSAIAAPLITAVLGAARAWKGTAWKVA